MTKVVELPELRLKLTEKEKVIIFARIRIRAAELEKAFWDVPLEQRGDWLAAAVRNFSIELAHSTPVAIDALIIAAYLGMEIGSLLAESDKLKGGVTA